LLFGLNNLQPNDGKLGGLTPNEAYQDQNVPIAFDPEALRTRIDENRGNTGCTSCETE